MKFSSKLYVAALTLALAPATSWALAISFGGSGTTAGLPLGARADFTTSANEIDLVLTNTLGIGDIRSSVQAISDITFTIVPSVVPLTVRRSHVGSHRVFTRSLRCVPRDYASGPLSVIRPCFMANRLAWARFDTPILV